MKQLTTNDKLTLSVSFLALAISFFSIYLQHFRVRDVLEVHILGWTTDAGRLGYIGNSMKVDLLIINRGDRQALVKDAGCYMKRGDTSGSSPLKQFESLPIILEPSEMRLTSIDIPLPKEPGRVADEQRQKFGIYFYSINSEGRLYYVTKNLFWRNYTKDGWIGKMLLDGSNMIVDLYSKGTRD